MAALQQARMACNAAGLVDKETQGSPKLEELGRLLEDLCLQSNHKVVVFSQWALMTEMVETVVRTLSLGSVRLYGGIPTHKRGELIEQFNNDASVQVFISTDAGGTGLNLQSATALINLDMPWNPAVLDQRIARIHRLGQKQKVQIFLLLAEDSYEQRVASLVKNKRNLFDNVISPDATEDVVGVSKKMLQTLIDDLSIAEPESIRETVEQPASSSEAIQEVQEPAVTKTSGPLVEEDESQLHHTIEKIQTLFLSRIEQILGSGGGLLVVVSQIEDTDEQTAQDLSEPEVPIAVIDTRTLRSLKRLGSASPVAETRTLFESTHSEQKQENPLLATAQQKLNSAEVLLQQQCSAGVMDLLASALMTKVAGLNGQLQTPSLDSAAVWLYSDIVPAQVLTQEQAGTIVRIISLSQSPEIPAPLIEQSLQDVRLFFSVFA
jgi:superfamily II DNA/RNA helicase